jgi:hypothetical protein
MPITLLLSHVAGARKHQFLDGEREFARMGLGQAPQPHTLHRTGGAG